MAPHEWYVSTFLKQVLDLEPRTVLDVGCGDGKFIGRLEANGVTANGIEPDESFASEKIISGNAEDLKAKSDSYDIVLSTYALHHFADPAKFLSEASRVARKNILVLDQWFDTSIPSQLTSQLYSRWQKRIERRSGIVHQNDFGSNEVLELLVQQRLEKCVSISTMFVNEFRSVVEIDAEITEFTSKMTIDGSDRERLNHIWSEIGNTGLTFDGAMAVSVDVSGRN